MNLLKALTLALTFTLLWVYVFLNVIFYQIPKDLITKEDEVNFQLIAKDLFYNLPTEFLRQIFSTYKG